MEELKAKLEGIEFLIAANIEQMNKANQEVSQKGQKEAEFLILSTKQLNSTIEEFKSKFGAFDDVLRNFNPTIEQRQVMVDVKKPLFWILGAVFSILISFSTCYVFYSQLKQERLEKAHWMKQSEIKDWNYMKYKYLLMFGEPRISNFLKNFDQAYIKNYQQYDQKVIIREQQLEQAARAEREAELKRSEAKKAQRALDSINAQIH